MPAPKSKSISVFAYTDFRDYLKDFYDRARSADPKFSQRYISQKVGASSSGWFSDLIKGRVNLSGTQLVRLAALLGLENQALGYFETLVHYNQSGSLEERNHHFRKLAAFKEVPAELLGQDKFEYYSKWYYSAIRELLYFHRFSADYADLARKLNPSIKSQEARDAIELLLRLGLIKKDAQGDFRPSGSTLKKDANHKSLFSANFLRSNMELGMQAIERFEKEERNISGMTLSFSETGFRKAVEEIEALRRRLLALLEEDPKPEKVYQLNLQLFPITR